MQYDGPSLFTFVSQKKYKNCRACDLVVVFVTLQVIFTNPMPRRLCVSICNCCYFNRRSMQRAEVRVPSLAPVKALTRELELVRALPLTLVEEQTLDVELDLALESARVPETELGIAMAAAPSPILALNFVNSYSLVLQCLYLALNK